MISTLSGTLVEDYPTPALLVEHSATSAFDPDRDPREPECAPAFSHALVVPGVAATTVGYGEPVPLVIGMDPECLTEDTNLHGRPFDLAHTLTNVPPILIGLTDRFWTEFLDQLRRAVETYHQYWIRIETLRSDAALEGFALNEASERDFWSFVKAVPSEYKAELVLVDNGNLRAIWDREDGSHVGLQFMGHRTLQYVIFRRRPGHSRVSRVAGRDTFEGVAQQLQAFGVEQLP